MRLPEIGLLTWFPLDLAMPQAQEVSGLTPEAFSETNPDGLLGLNWVLPEGTRCTQCTATGDRRPETARFQGIVRKVCRPGRRGTGFDSPRLHQHERARHKCRALCASVVSALNRS